MLNKATIFFLALLVLPMISNAQDNKLFKKAPIVLEKSKTTSVLRNDGKTITTAAAYVAVDTMQNSFGTASGDLNPLAYDADANVAAVVHRARNTYGAGSGELWYNISTDKGTTWTRVTAGINSALPLSARYPSMAISNPTGGDISQTVGIFSWPQLNPNNPNGFGFVGYGADQLVGGGIPFADVDQNLPEHGASVPTFVSDNSSWVFWTSDNRDDARIELWRTQDFVTIENIQPSQWSDTVFQSNGNIALGGASQNGILYYAVIGSFVPPDINNLILSGWFPGYSKSTDNGANWSDFQVIDFRTIPALSAFDRLWDYIKGDAFISYQGDVNADKDGYVHIVTGVTDTIGSNNSGRNALVEIFETSGGWDGKIIADNLSELTFTKLTGPALGQMGPCAYIAANKNKDVFAASWVAGSPSAGDSLCDVYFSYRSMDGEWSAAQNLTETDGMNENSSHFAPTLAEGNNPGEYIAFSFYNYEAGNTSYDIVEDNPSVIYIAPVPFMILTGVSDDNFSPFSFKLEQNYPNPFNPTTKIKYVIPNVVDAKFASTTLVILKIYDILGNEVATIVNKEQQPGNYEVEFNAKNLSSGIYFYKISARNFHQTKKMVLMK